MHLNKLLLEFYRVYVSKEEFPILRASAIKWSILDTHIYANNFYYEHHKKLLRIKANRRKSWHSVNP